MYVVRVGLGASAMSAWMLQAEISALEPQLAELQRAAVRGEGGGLALLRISHRFRQLSWKLAGLQADKETVKAESW